MKKINSINYTNTAFNIAMLLLRVGSGVMIVSHGYSKLVHFSQMKSTFLNFFGIGPTLSLVLIIFAEFFCGIFLVLGLFSRLAVIPLVIAMAVVVFKVTQLDVFGNGEKGALYLLAFFTILLCGPGKISVDGMMK